MMIDVEISTKLHRESGDLISTSISITGFLAFINEADDRIDQVFDEYSLY